LKIPLIEAEVSGSLRDIVVFTVKCGTISFFTKAIIDNGCPNVLIDQLDLARTRIPYKARFKQVEGLPLGLGTHLFDRLDMGICELIFKDIEGKVHTFKHQTYAMICQDEKVLSVGSSLIGRDFLGTFNLGLSRKDKDGKRFLEGDDSS
jgi:hypothetical protein